MVFSTRISIQWPPSPAEELTKTYVMTSPKEQHFVDLRPYLSNTLPIAQSGFPFEWAISGTEEELEDGKIMFHHEVDSQGVLSSHSLNQPLSDLGHFEQLPNGDRKETGEMRNPLTGKVQPYVEIWRSLDPNMTTPTKEVKEESGSSNQTLVYVLAVDDTKRKGKLIRMGNWIQGILYDMTQPNEQSLSIIRAFYDGKEWQKLTLFGSALFPCNFTGKKEDKLMHNDLVWICIE